MATKLTPEVAQRCRDLARSRIRNYAAGRSEASRAVSYRGAERNLLYQLIGIMAECIFAVELRLDPIRHVNWSLDPDAGSDFGRFLRVDVKGTTMHGRRLIWPLGKRHIFVKKNFDALVLTLVDVQTAIGRSVGFVLKDDFAAECRIAQPGDGSRLDTGTWYMDMNELRPIELFLQTHRIAPVAA